MPSHDGTALLEARGLQRSFGRVRILHGLDLSLQPGEALAIIGPNGAGKTTLLRLLAGLIRPSAGEVRVLGHRLGREFGLARHALGVLLHQSLLYDDLTLLENLTFAARLYALDRPGAGRVADHPGRQHDRPDQQARGEEGETSEVGDVGGSGFGKARCKRRRAGAGQLGRGQQGRRAAAVLPPEQPAGRLAAPKETPR